MTEQAKDLIAQKLSKIIEPVTGKALTESGMLSEIVFNQGTAMLSLTVPADKAEAMQGTRKTVQAAIESVEGVEKAMVVLTAQQDGSKASATPPSPKAAKPASQQAPIRTPHGTLPPKEALPGVEHIIAVASGKGGVGKSTTAVNLALAMHMAGLKVGLLDADIYGPSVPRLLKLSDKPEVNENKKIIAHEAYGIKAMSIGFMVEEATPTIWRGPMVMSALTQLLKEVMWAPLDILIVDMPPGTGDAQLTLSQTVPLSGAVIVSTPQDLALVDARKGLNMFRRVEVPVLGIIENMSYFLCPSCGDRSDIFGSGGARVEATRLGVPFLGEIPLHMDIRAHADAGHPIVVAEPEGGHGLAYRQIAASVLSEMQSVHSA